MAETMKDYEAELEASFKKIEEGDILTGTVISVDEKEVILDLKYYAEGVIPVEDYSREPGFSLKENVHAGDEVSATVVRKDDGNGNILLSRSVRTGLIVILVSVSQRSAGCAEIFPRETPPVPGGKERDSSTLFRKQVWRMA